MITENGLSMFLWIGHNVEPQWVQKVFSVQSAAQIDIDKVSHSPVLDSVENFRFIHAAFHIKNSMY